MLSNPCQILQECTTVRGSDMQQNNDFKEFDHQSPRAYFNGPLWFQYRKLTELLNMPVKFTLNRREHAFSQLKKHTEWHHTLKYTSHEVINIIWNSISLKQSLPHPAFWESASAVKSTRGSHCIFVGIFKAALNFTSV